MSLVPHHCSEVGANTNTAAGYYGDSATPNKAGGYR